MKKIFPAFQVLLITISPLCYAQSNFETLIPWNDTSVNGLYAREMPDSSFLVLSNNQFFYPGPGILIEGPPTYGTGLVKLSQLGFVAWKQLYRNVSGGQSIVPSASFFPVQNKIIIPFVRYVGYVACDSTGLAAPSYKTGVMRADRATGGLLDLYLYNDDTLCSRTAFMAFATINDSITVAIESGFNDRRNYISIRTIPDSLVSQYSIDTNYILGGSQSGSFIYTPSDTSFTIYAYHKPSSRKKIVEISSNGEITEVFSYDVPKWHYSYYFEKLNGSYYFIMEETDSMRGGFVKSYLLKYSENGTIGQQLDLHDSKVVDLEITPDGEILLLCDKSKGTFYDSMPAPVRVYLLDAGLDILKYRDFGFPYVSPSHITTTSYNGFIITGTLLKDIIDEDIREPNQVYFLKSSIDSINLVWTNIPKSEEATSKSFKVYPNPFNKTFTIEFEIDNQTSVQFSIYDYTGKQIKLIEKKQLQKGKYTEQINSEQFANGIYLLVANINGHLQIMRISSQ